MSPTGPKLPTTAADGGGGTATWLNVNNALTEDGAFAECDNLGPGGGGLAPDQLLLRGMGFAIPSTAVIDGIKLEVKCNATRGSTPQVYLAYNGGTTKSPTSNNPNWGTTGLVWLTYGSSTELWGKTWTPADINNANFGASVAAMPFSGSGWSIYVDAVRITVYWHTAPANVPKRYLYKVFNSTGKYLGNLPNVVSEFNPVLDINSAGLSLGIECATSPDIALNIVDIYTDESGVPYTDEAGVNNYTTEGNITLVSPNVALMAQGNAFYDALIKNGNILQVWESGYYYPNGLCRFNGMIENWKGGFGGDGGHDSVKIVAYSDGYDLDNYMARGAPFTYTTDQSQTSQNTGENIQTVRGTFNKSGQSFRVGAGVTNIGAITVMVNGTANVTIKLWDSYSQITLLGTASQNVSVTNPTALQVAFPYGIPVTAGTSYFFSVEVDDGQSITVYYQNTDVYANGQHFTASYAGGSGGGAFGAATGDLYFITASSSGSTTGTYTSQDPSIGMLEPIVTDYNGRGGLITYSSSTIDATGLSLTVTFNTNTILEAIKSILDLSPNGFYWYVDPGTDTLYFKKVSTTADFTITKGVHINDIEVGASIENVKNQDFFSGGTVSGSNIYTTSQDNTSITAYGVRLNRESNNRITDLTTAQTVAKGTISKLKDEQYQTQIIILDQTMDITLLKPGKTIGFNGFGTFVDNLILQIARVEYHPHYAVVQVGNLPLRMADDYEKITRGLLAAQTVANPTSPS